LQALPILAIVLNRFVGTRLDERTGARVGASWALLELTMWARRPRLIWLAAGLLAAVDLIDSIGDPFGRTVSGVFGLGVKVGLRLLLGLVIRTTREPGRQAEERAAEEQRRRESEGRAAHAARAYERSAIARELHDVLTHHVASMVLRVDVARHVLADLDPRVDEVFNDVHGTGPRPWRICAGWSRCCATPMGRAAARR